MVGFIPSFVFGHGAQQRYQANCSRHFVTSLPQMARTYKGALKPTRSSIRRYSTTCHASGSTTVTRRRRIGVLVSGSGRSVENLCERIRDGLLQRCDIAVMISSKRKAGALERVQPFKVETRVIRPVDFDKDTERFSNAISTALDEFGVDIIVMAGWMHFYLIPTRYEGRVINIHPSLIPSFCGKGYYGSRVHEAAVCFLLQGRRAIHMLFSLVAIGIPD